MRYTASMVLLQLLLLRYARDVIIILRILRR